MAGTAIVQPPYHPARSDGTCGCCPDFPVCASCGERTNNPGEDFDTRCCFSDRSTIALTWDFGDGGLGGGYYGDEPCTYCPGLSPFMLSGSAILQRNNSAFRKYNPSSCDWEYLNCEAIVNDGCEDNPAVWYMYLRVSYYHGEWIIDIGVLSFDGDVCIPLDDTVGGATALYRLQFSIYLNHMGAVNGTTVDYDCCGLTATSTTGVGLVSGVCSLTEFDISMAVTNNLCCNCSGDGECHPVTTNAECPEWVPRAVTLSPMDNENDCTEEQDGDCPVACGDCSACPATKTVKVTGSTASDGEWTVTQTGDSCQWEYEDAQVLVELFCFETYWIVRVTDDFNSCLMEWHKHVLHENEGLDPCPFNGAGYALVHNECGGTSPVVTVS